MTVLIHLYNYLPMGHMMIGIEIWYNINRYFRNIGETHGRQ